MAQKLWEKNVQVNADIDRFTVGKDREMDLYLAPYDILGSIAHITMLEYRIIDKKRAGYSDRRTSEHLHHS